MRPLAWLSFVVAVLAQGTASLTSETLTCSTWQGIRTCSSLGGYLSHESTWHGITSGDDNQGNRWTTSRWRDFTTTTVEPRPER
jgi:hypothetical protein